MRGSLTNQSFGFLTPGEIARGLLPDAVRESHRAGRRATVDRRLPFKIDAQARSTRRGQGAMRVFRDGTGEDMGEVSWNYFTDGSQADWTGYGGGSTLGPAFTPEQVMAERRQGSLQALSDLLQELERDKRTAGQGYVDQGLRLADDAWSQAQAALMLAPAQSRQDDTTGDIVWEDAKTYPEYGQAFQAYVDAKNFITDLQSKLAMLPEGSRRAITGSAQAATELKASVDRSPDAEKVNPSTLPGVVVSAGKEVANGGIPITVKTGLEGLLDKLAKNAGLVIGGYVVGKLLKIF